MITIYSKENCGACKTAKQYCDQYSLDYEYKVLNTDYNLSEFFSIAPRTHKSFPMIAVDGNYIGGLNELKLRNS